MKKIEDINEYARQYRKTPKSQNYYKLRWKRKKIEKKLKSFKKKTDKLKIEYRFSDQHWNDEIITGIILSDAYLRKIDDGMNSCIELEQSDRYEQFVLHFQHYLQDLGLNSGLYRYLHKNTNTWGIRVFSQRHRYFTLLRKRWYLNNVKIVPKDIILTAKTLAYWFMGDGYCTWRSKNACQVDFCTEGFSDDSVKFLANKLSSLGIENITIFKVHNGGLRIRIGRMKEINKFFDLVEPFILDCFKYKIKRPYRIFPVKS